MKDLLSTVFISHLNQRKPVDDSDKAPIPAVVPFQTTNEETFDLLDKVDPYFRQLGTGSVTYHNPSLLDIVAINYEQLLNSLPLAITKKLKRPDYLVYDDAPDGRYFIINELSQGKPASKRNDAKLQMFNAVKTLSDIPQTKQWIDNRTDKWCVFSCRSSFPETPQGIADAFGMNGKNLPERVEIKFQPITKAGFSAFETDVITLE